MWWHHYFTCTRSPPLWAQRLEAKIDQLIAAQATTQRREEREEQALMTMIDAIKKLQDDVAAQTEVVQSAEMLINSIPQLIRDAAGDPAALEQLASTIEANSAGLADAVAANTPAAPTV